MLWRRTVLSESFLAPLDSLFLDIDTDSMFLLTRRSKSLDCLTYNSIKRIVDTVLGEIRLGSNVALADAIAHSRDAIVTGIEKAMQRNELDVLIGFQGKVRGYFDKMVANIVAAKAKQDTLEQLKKF